MQDGGQSARSPLPQARGSAPVSDPRQPTPSSAKSEDFLLKAPELSLPRGGGAMKGIGEKFAANPVTGTGSMSIPLALSPGRGGFGPQLALAYDSGAGNGPFGLGWSLGLPSIQRKTDKGLPRYDDANESDVFLLAGAEDLVPVDHADETTRLAGKQYHVRRYRPRIEGLFARIERWVEVGMPANTFWRSISRDNVTTWFGRSEDSRILDLDNPARIFQWLICQTHDDKGNVALYRYARENDANVDVTTPWEANRSPSGRLANAYIKRIQYGNVGPFLPAMDEDAEDPLPTQWLLEAVFDYGDHAETFPSPTPTVGANWPARTDAFSSHRAGFEIRTYRLCRRVLMFHHFEDAPDVGVNCLVRATEFNYAKPTPGAPAGDPSYATLQSVIHRHYQRHAGSYASRELPPVSFRYSQPVVAPIVRIIPPDQLENLPVGTQGPTYRWIDLDGEGLSGVLSEQVGGWYYKPGRGDGTFGPTRLVAPLPATAAAAGSRHQFMDLGGDGEIDIVEFDGPAPGFHERDRDSGWKQHVPFASLPNIDWNDPNLRFVDLTGDGHADALITEHEVFIWYPSLDERGFAAAQRTRQPFDENAGPHLVFADGTQSIFLADMCGDGLTDLVRIRHAEVCYWPNLGYGRFGRKVTLGGAPRFDSIDQFDPARIRLADIDGSGPVDIIYLGQDGARLYFNRSGNALGPPLTVALPVATHNLGSVQVADLLGNGTACLVWNSHLPADMQRPVRYIDLMGGAAESVAEHRKHVKPHLLIGVDNHRGAITTIEYTPSTQFYLQDLQAGRPWVTRLPFPVHCVSKVKVHDKWRKTTFSTCYSYHHGYFDGAEREFRGFGRVEQWDTEAFHDVQAANTGSAHVTQDRTLYQPPVKTVSWFHTGVAQDRQRILGAFEHEYFTATHAALFASSGFSEPSLPQPDIDPGTGPALDAEEWREAMRACKGMPLRQEVYELDARALEQDGRHVPVRLFTAAQHNCHIRRIQPRGERRHAVFMALESEAYTCHYELDLRTLASQPPSVVDPRVAHTLNLKFDDYGRTQQVVSVAYPRHGRYVDALQTQETRDLVQAVQAERHIAYAESRYTSELEPVHHRLHHRLPLACEVLTYELTGSNTATGFAPSRGQYFAPEDFRRFKLSDTLPSQGTKPVIDLPYHMRPGSGDAHKRLIEHLRTQYWDDASANAPPTAPLAIGTHGPRALKYQEYKLALTDRLLAAVFGTGSSDKLDWEFETNKRCRDLLNTPAISGYVSGASNGMRTDQYWLRSGIAGFEPDAHEHYFLPERFTDAFGQTATLKYDPWDWYVASSTDAKGNRTAIEAFDFRVLAPTRMRDPNHNITMVAFDILGLPVATATLGKVRPGTAGAPETTESGNRLDEFSFDLLNPSPGQVAGFFGEANNPTPFDHVQARRWLGKASGRFVYHFGERRDAHGQLLGWAATPPGACGITREQHEGDQPNANPDLGAGGIAIQVAFEYTDGAGQVFVRNVQAEPETEGGALRWLTNGLTVLNNKGKPVLHYEPYFSGNGHRYAEPNAHGVSPVMHYDAPGRLVRTDMPDGTVSRVEFSPWFSRSFDGNDTVLESRWYQEKGRNALPPDQPFPTPPFVNRPPPTADERAGWLAAQHANTPAETHFDSLGREVVAIAHNRTPDANGIWIDERYLTYTKLDAEGKPLWIRDARGNLVMQYITPPKPTRAADEADPTQPERMPAASTPCYDIAGNLLHQHSMDGGGRWMLMDAAGQPLLAWDANERTDDNGTTFQEHRLYRTDHDALHRPTAQWLRVWQRARPQTGVTPQPFQPQEPVMLEWLEYRDGLNPDPDNLNGQLVRHYDASGLVRTVRRKFTGEMQEVHRRLVADQKASVIDWRTAPTEVDARLEANTYKKITEHDALGRMTRLLNWHRDITYGPGDAEQPTLGATNRVAVYVPEYNERGLLKAEWLHVRARKTTSDGRVEFAPDANPNPVVNRPAIVAIAYNAKGQKTELTLGNGTVTRYTYDPENFRLTRLYTRRDAAWPGDCAGNPDAAEPARPCGVQNLRYTYDAVGNITHIRNDAQQTIWFRNSVVEPSCDYTYDALNRLVEAKGREQAGVAGPPAIPEGPWPQGPMPSDRSLRRYTQRYEYDEVGNFKVFRHIAHEAGGQGSWQRHYRTAADSNRLLQTRIGDDHWSAAGSIHDAQYRYDTHGSMLNLGATPSEFDLHWDRRDMIRHIQLGGGGDAWYQYDSGKQRTRKFVVRDGGNVVEERLYLGGFERYRRRKGNIVVEEIESHHLFEGEQRVLLVDDVLKVQDQPGPGGMSLSEPACWRYQYGNHLGSVGVELDDAARVISYEEFHPYGTSAYRMMNDDAAVRAPAKRYRYTGMERDGESGLSYHTARYYLPWLGRWGSCDPSGQLDGPNAYCYSRDRATLATDRNGQQSSVGPTPNDQLYLPAFKFPEILNDPHPEDAIADLALHLVSYSPARVLMPMLGELRVRHQLEHHEISKEDADLARLGTALSIARSAAAKGGSQPAASPSASAPPQMPPLPQRAPGDSHASSAGPANGPSLPTPAPGAGMPPRLTRQVVTFQSPKVDPSVMAVKPAVAPRGLASQVVILRSPKDDRPVVLMERDGAKSAWYRSAGSGGQTGKGTWVQFFGIARTQKLDRTPGTDWYVKQRGGMKLPSDDQPISAELRKWWDSNGAQGMRTLVVPETDLKPFNTWLKFNGVRVGGDYKPGDLAYVPLFIRDIPVSR